MNADEFREVLLLNRDIEILMKSSLFLEQCIDTPAAVNPNFDTKAFERVVQIKHIVRFHVGIGCFRFTIRQ